MTNILDGMIAFDSVSLDAMGTHLLFGPIDENSAREAASFILKSNNLQSSPELSIFINTMGGTTNDGFALIDIIEISKIPISTVAIGNICSMGVLIAAAGTKGKRVMTRNTQVMAHQFNWEIGGKYHELQATRRTMDYSAHQFISHFKRHSSMTEDEIKSILFGPSDTWLTPSDCLKYGLVDHVIDELSGF